YICGAIGLVWSIWWFISYRNLPEDHPLVNREELKHIRGVDSTGAIKEAAIERKAASVPWSTLLRSPNMWAIMCGYFTYVYCLWIFLSWLPSYLVEFRHFTLLKVGLFASMPLFAGVLGDTAGGLATDWLLKVTGNTKLARSSVAIVGLGMLCVHRARRVDQQCLYRRLLPDRINVLFGMHHRSVLGGADGRWRQIFGHRIRYDEHGRQFRRGAVAAGIRLPGSIRQLAGAFHRRSRPACHRRCRVGLLARSGPISARDARRLARDATARSSGCGMTRGWAWADRPPPWGIDGGGRAGDKPGEWCYSSPLAKTKAQPR